MKTYIYANIAGTEYCYQQLEGQASISLAHHLGQRLVSSASAIQQQEHAGLR